MKLLTAAQMRALDQHCIEILGIPSLELMERAGEAVARTSADLLPHADAVCVILCGKGNNGGDGLVAARLLHAAGKHVHVVLSSPPDALSPDARAMYERLPTTLAVSATISDEELATAAVVIDALLGTGVRGPVTGEMADLITRTNRLRQRARVLAVDIPSGVDADTGNADGPAIAAELTLTMGVPKLGLLLQPGASLAGRWDVVDLGFPANVVAAWPGAGELLERSQVTAWLPPRPATAHKRSVGWVLAIAGSLGMTGAAAMACQAAYRAGAGLVRLAVPASLVPSLNAALPQVVFRPMPATPRGTLSFRAVARLLREAHTVQATLIGPGLSCNAATHVAVRRLIAVWPGPLVVDADALTALAGHANLCAARTASTILTPHPGELSRLLALPVAAVLRDRRASAVAAAHQYHAVVVAKGTPTLIALPTGEVLLAPTGNPGLAVAGSGDTLAGYLVALLAQGLAPHVAAAVACFVGGRCADRIAERRGIVGMTALDLIEEFPASLAEFTRD
jgi:hydroxyethylthiazole kinase-like uncharacterized protein yjeF